MAGQNMERSFSGNRQGHQQCAPEASICAVTYACRRGVKNLRANLELSDASGRHRVAVEGVVEPNCLIVVSAGQTFEQRSFIRAQKLNEPQSQMGPKAPPLRPE